MRLATTILGIALGCVLLVVPHGGRPGPEIRQASEALVMVLQLVGAAVVVWSKLHPRSGLAAAALGATTLALGVVGVVCARFDSVFALFAGSTIVAILLAETLGAAEPEPSASAPSTPAAVVARPSRMVKFDLVPIRTRVYRPVKIVVASTKQSPLPNGSSA
jgi:hypothetical protein